MKEFESYNVRQITVMKLGEDTHLYQLTMDLSNRPEHSSMMQKKLDQLRQSGAIMEIERVGKRALEITRGPAHDWDRLDDEIVEALIMGTTGREDSVPIKFDPRLGRPNQVASVSTDREGFRHFKILESVNA